MLNSRLPEIAAELAAAVHEAAVAGAHLVEESAKARVPVDTGRLQRAIHVEEREDGVAVVAGDKDAFYGHIVEHGGVNHPPHPFLVPSLEENREPIERAIAEAVKRTVR